MAFSLLENLCAFSDSLQFIADFDQLDGVISSWLKAVSSSRPHILQDILALDPLVLAADQEKSGIRIGVYLRVLFSTLEGIPNDQKYPEAVLSVLKRVICSLDGSHNSHFLSLVKLIADRLLQLLDSGRSEIPVIMANLREISIGSIESFASSSDLENSTGPIPVMAACVMMEKFAAYDSKQGASDFLEQTYGLLLRAVRFPTLEDSKRGEDLVMEQKRLTRHVIPAYLDAIELFPSPKRDQLREQWCSALWSRLYPFLTASSRSLPFASLLLPLDAGTPPTSATDATSLTDVLSSGRVNAKSNLNREGGVWRGEAFGLLCRAFSHMHRSPENPTGYDIRFAPGFWSVVRGGLGSSDPLERKQSLHILKNSLLAAAMSHTAQKGTVHEKKGAKGKSKKEKGEAQTRFGSDPGWDAFLAIYETLNEFSSHLFKEVWGRLHMALDSAHRNGDLSPGSLSRVLQGNTNQIQAVEVSAHGEPLLDFSWILILFERSFKHVNHAVISHAVAASLEIDPTRTPSAFAHRDAWFFVVGPFLASLDDASFYRDVSTNGCGQKAHTSNLFLKFLERFLSVLPTQQLRAWCMRDLITSFGIRDLCRVAQVSVLDVLASESIFKLLACDSTAQSVPILDEVSLDALRSFVVQRVSTLNTLCCRYASFRYVLCLLCQYADVAYLTQPAQAHVSMSLLGTLLAALPRGLLVTSHDMLETWLWRNDVALQLVPVWAEKMAQFISKQACDGESVTLHVLDA
eukprot:TRINITY_DN915_c0_g1::TRINITY_DN915_c0_g1_i1::g.15940::m.15940 TRINITY_DN915_c0_g1::TRINITY_DN915_c0_g1_i1::g.15940  ORF type:complete len:746 (+),score=84.43,sp/Q13395/TARB1_HUMAN/22.73/8e-07 TRINITY_DN915_c0_g1_i1:52-2289(+)